MRLPVSRTPVRKQSKLSHRLSFAMNQRNRNQFRINQNATFQPTQPIQLRLKENTKRHKQSVLKELHSQAMETITRKRSIHRFANKPKPVKPKVTPDQIDAAILESSDDESQQCILPIKQRSVQLPSADGTKTSEPCTSKSTTSSTEKFDTPGPSAPRQTSRRLK